MYNGSLTKRKKGSSCSTSTTTCVLCVLLIVLFLTVSLNVRLLGIMRSSETTNLPFADSGYPPQPSSNYLDVDYDVCIAGAGLSGSVLAERYATELNSRVLVVEKRNHIGGNCYDFIDPETGIRISKYGAHLFHTKYKDVENYVKQFSKWVPYEHKVRGIVNKKYVPIPVNIETVNTLFGENIRTAKEMQEWLSKEQIPAPPGGPRNSEEVALSRVGPRLYDLIFRPYTIKQWAKDPSQLGPEVLARIPVRNDTEDRYFSDPFQALPAAGYTALFQRMLSSPLITVKTGTDFFKIRPQLKCGRIYFSGPIDAYFASTGWPKLEYRSLDFERVVAKNTDFFQPYFVVNHPQNNTDFTRIVEYKHLLDQKSPHTVYFIERSKDGGEPYYPVPNERNKKLFQQYKDLANKEPGVSFVGRLANYKYFNMDQAIKNALDMFEQDTGIPFKGFEKIGLAYRPSVQSSQGLAQQRVNNASLVAEERAKLKSFTKQLAGYTNYPTVLETPQLNARVDRAMKMTVDTPVGLRHKAHPPGHDVVMGLAAYPVNMPSFRLIVGSLRNAGYDGHIILGVHTQIPVEEEEYLKKMDVTYYIVDFVECDPSILDAGKDGGNIRGKCSPGLENLKLEWGRFEMCRQWLNECKECTGWALVMDTRDIFFQRNPFSSLPPPDQAEQDLLFIEEIAPHSNPRPDTPYRADIIGHSRYVARTEPCYGKDHYTAYFNRPILCSGTIIGTRQGMHRFLSVLVDEFHSNNKKPEKGCRSPVATDQWTMDYLYYNGRFGYFNRTATLPWGTGPINTVGTPCVNRKYKEGSAKYGHNDLILFDDEKNLILNNHEPDDSPARVVAGIHQYDRCSSWMHKFIASHPEFSQKEKGRYIPVDKLPPLPWKTNDGI